MPNTIPEEVKIKNKKKREKLIKSLPLRPLSKEHLKTLQDGDMSALDKLHKSALTIRQKIRLRVERENKQKVIKEEKRLNKLITPLHNWLKE